MEQRQIEIIIYFIPIVISVLATLFYSIYGTNKKLKTKTMNIQIGIMNFVIFLLGSILWLLFVSDGISQINGIFLYLGIFVAIEVISLLIAYLSSKRR